MKNLVLLISLCLFISPAQASFDSPALVQGTFAYRGSYSIIGKRHFVVIPQLNDEADRRAEKLRGEGYTCVIKAGTQYLCSKNVPHESSDRRVADYIAKIYQGASIQFYKAYGFSEQYRGETYRQWSADQKIAISMLEDGKRTERLFSFAHYSWMQGVDKVYPGGTDNPRHDLFVIEADRLYVPMTIIIQKSRFEMEQFFAQADFDRTQL